MKKLYMLSIAALLMAGCAEEVTTNNYNGQFITFSVADDSQTQSGESGGQPFTVASTRTTEFVPQNSLFTKEKSDNLQPIPVESDYEEQLYLTISTGNASKGTTRGTQNYVTDLENNGFGVYEATFFPSGGTATHSTGSSFTTSTSWSGDASTNHDFYAWYPSSGSGIVRDGNKITYNMSGLSATATSDLLTAKTTEKYSTNNGQVALSFKHQLTPVLFTLSGVPGNIKKIKFSSLTTKAETVIGSNSWTSKTTGEYEHTVSSGDLGGSQYFMMIPQTIGSGTVITITVEDTQTSGKINHILKFTTTGAVTWAAGTPITYTISTGTITTMSVTYPKWNKVGGGTEDGPVTAYASGDKFGLYAVDKNNKIVYDNLQVPISSSDVTKLDLSTFTGAGMIFPSQYTYYLYYPYQATLTGAPTNDQTTYSTVAQDAAGQATDSDAADTFFANVVAGWTVENGLIETNQSPLGNLKKSDLQIAAVTATGSATKAFSMAHQMGLAKVTLGSKSVPTIQYYTVSGTDTETKGTTEGTTTVTASSTFTGNTMFISGTTCYAVLPKSTNRAFKGIGLDVWTETYTANAAAGECCTYTAASKRTFIKKGWIYEYVANNMYNLTITQAGSYKLEVWGAEGGMGGTWTERYGGYATTDTIAYYVGYHGPEGGYSVGNASLSGTIYICVGGAGKRAWCRGYTATYIPQGGTGGYNGGGRGGDAAADALAYHNVSSASDYTKAYTRGGGGGGGATHIAKASGVLSTLSSNKSAVLIVAGGGGGLCQGGRIADGAEYTYSKGGGESGLNGTSLYYSSGGSQSAGYAFGRGADALNEPYWKSGTAEGDGGGGGGWYGGYATSLSVESNNGAGGGGSGYIGGVTGGSTSVGGRLGNGYARITTNFEWSFE